MAKKINVTVWNEGLHEESDKAIAKLYPAGMHAAIAAHLNKQAGIKARTATLEQPDHGLSDAVLDKTNVLIWWGHIAHDRVSDTIVNKVHEKVLRGMGLIVLHNAHVSKIFRKLMGTTCQLKWREAGEREVLWVTPPGHPILEGIEDHFILPHEEMYGEHFDVPEPDETILISGFTGGEVFRSGCTWRRGAGKVFYFRPGHESYPTFHDANVLRVLTNAVRWGVSTGQMPIDTPQKDMGWFEKKKRG